MARIRSLLGDIEGSAGQITSSKQNGKNILRQKVGSNSSNSPAQQNTRSRFKLLADLYKKFSGALQVGLKAQNGQSAYNRFVGQNFYNTSADALAVASLDYTKLVLSGGGVEPLSGVTAALDAVAGKVTVSFADNSNGNTALEMDVVKVVVANQLTGRVVTSAEEDATRGDGTLEVEDDALIGVQAADLMAYAFAYRANGSDASSTSIAQVG